uniref:Uncharacterized protein n=1 Tax=Globodera rostochiensis TaxID=31243 RepID=A0A914HDG9_GLORO
MVSVFQELWARVSASQSALFGCPEQQCACGQRQCNEQNRPRRREPCFVRNCLPSDCAELRELNAHTTGMMDGNYTGKGIK